MNGGNLGNRTLIRSLQSYCPAVERGPQNGVELFDSPTVSDKHSGRMSRHSDVLTDGVPLQRLKMVAGARLALACTPYESGLELSPVYPAMKMVGIVRCDLTSPAPKPVSFV